MAIENFWEIWCDKYSDIKFLKERRSKIKWNRIKIIMNHIQFNPFHDGQFRPSQACVGSPRLGKASSSNESFKKFDWTKVNELNMILI